MKRPALVTLLVLFVCIPLTLVLGMQLSGRWYYLTSTLIAAEIMVPFFFSFEHRRPQARELVLIAVISAIAAVSRVVVPIPNFKPIFGVVMIAGIAFGPQSGFLVGAISAFASNFFTSQGPWTPWQMLAYGVAGLLAGALVKAGVLKKKPVHLAVFGFLALPLCVGLLLDLSSVFTMLTELSWAGVLSVYAYGLPVNISQGVSTAVTMLLFSRPLLNMLERIRVKYGVLDGGSDT